MLNPLWHQAPPLKMYLYSGAGLHIEVLNSQGSPSDNILPLLKTYPGQSGMLRRLATGPSISQSSSCTLASSYRWFRTFQIKMRTPKYSICVPLILLIIVTAGSGISSLMDLIVVWE
ncbi:hypothetical protein BJ508DRAFT_41765 [Ascobolus immersus RN42]|uniref:Uncharacterized protein n=1 Tax=Ascobolus immersus RN42 TaxID=1160509 RepID=A0A3N4IDC6_ASCIM|nr:hypothetical protein BJ508DRAFT_41765 [Ascobolus immersus RN42]